MSAALIAAISGAARRRAAPVGAFPQVLASSVYEATATAMSHDVPLPSGVQSGDLLVIFHRITGTTPKTASGWTSIVDDRVAVFFRHADGSEGASVNVATSNNQRAASIVLRIGGHRAATAPIASSIVADTLDPPELAPGVGAEKILWIAGAACGRAVTFTAPSDYGSILQGSTDTGSTNNEVSLAIAFREREAASENPGAFTSTGSPLNLEAFTLAIRPA